MKTYKIYLGSSEGFNPIHIFKAASFRVEGNFYIFYDDIVQPLHAIAISPGMFVRTEE